MGVVNHRSPLFVGMDVTLRIANPFENQGAVPPIEMRGKLVAVRGHSSDNDEWEIVVRADNSVLGDPHARRLPLNYSVQREDIEVTIG